LLGHIVTTLVVLEILVVPVSQSLFSRELRCNSHLSEVRLAGICGPVCENLSEDRPSAT